MCSSDLGIIPESRTCTFNLWIGPGVAGRTGLGGYPLDVIELHRPTRLVDEAVKAVGGGELGDGNGPPLALQLVELVGDGRLGLGPIRSRRRTTAWPRALGPEVPWSAQPALFILGG